MTHAAVPLPLPVQYGWESLKKKENPAGGPIYCRHGGINISCTRVCVTRDTVARENGQQMNAKRRNNERGERAHGRGEEGSWGGGEN